MPPFLPEPENPTDAIAVRLGVHCFFVASKKSERSPLTSAAATTWEQRKALKHRAIGFKNVYAGAVWLCHHNMWLR